MKAGYLKFVSKEVKEVGHKEVGGAVVKVVGHAQYNEIGRDVECHVSLSPHQDDDDGGYHTGMQERVQPTSYPQEEPQVRSNVAMAALQCSRAALDLSNHCIRILALFLIGRSSQQY